MKRGKIIERKLSDLKDLSEEGFAFLKALETKSVHCYDRESPYYGMEFCSGRPTTKVITALKQPDEFARVIDFVRSEITRSVAEQEFKKMSPDDLIKEYQNFDAPDPFESDHFGETPYQEMIDEIPESDNIDLDRVKIDDPDPDSDPSPDPDVKPDLEHIPKDMSYDEYYTRMTMDLPPNKEFLSS